MSARPTPLSVSPPVPLVTLSAAKGVLFKFVNPLALDLRLSLAGSRTPE
jgi:hypothetical protein